MRSLLAVLVCVRLLGAVAFAAPPEPGGSRSPVRQKLAWPHPALGTSRSGAPEVMFTFDDGPQSGSTDAVLDTLRVHGVHAVFFIVGRRVTGAEPRAKELVSRMLDEHHVIGNHTWHHMHLCQRLSLGKYGHEIDDNALAIRDVAQMSTVFFRAPYGARCAYLEKALAERGISHLHWDIDPQEWKWHSAARTAAVVIGNIRRLRDGDRAVLLVHDTQPSTAAALPEILDWIDAENQRRVAAGRRPIHVLDPADIALEKLAPGVAASLGLTRSALLDFVPELARRFFAPMTPPVAKVNL